MLTESTGPVAESVKNETAKTGNDISGLTSKRVQPDQQTATGQPLTRRSCSNLSLHRQADRTLADYHSFFYSLLSVSRFSRLNEETLTRKSGNILVLLAYHLRQQFCSFSPHGICLSSDGC